MNKIKFVLFAAGISLALGFTFGCSSDDGGGSGGGNPSGNGSLSSSSNGGVSSGGDGSSSSIAQSSNSALKECAAKYNQMNQFCYDGTVYNKCGGNSYNPTKQGCLNGYTVAEKCGNNLYTQTVQFCYDGTVYNKCDGKIYNPVTQGCVNGKFVDTKCGSIWYDQAIQTCCGSFFYNQQTQFCYDGVVSAKCDGMEYPLATHICQNGVAIPAKCDGESYNPLTQNCSNGTLINYDIIVDARDGKRYKTVEIGSQTWMAENLNYNASGSRCYGDNTGGDRECNCATYGRLYNYATAMEVCPKDWHLSTGNEWVALINLAGGEDIAGKYLKATNGWRSVKGKSDNGEDKFGFSALPGGEGVSDYFSSVGVGGIWWVNWGGPSSIDIGYYGNYAHGSSDRGDPYFLLSVRCVQDD